MPRDLPWRNWIPWLVGGLSVLVLIVLLLPAVQQAREAARRSSSKNNLKQLGLAFYNYHDVHKCFPPGGVFAEDDTPYHSWGILILPYVEASPLPSYTDSDYAWNDPVNEHVFRRPYSILLNPVLPDESTEEGYSVSHYSLNQSLFYRNSSVSLDELDAETSRVWMGAEIFHEWQPWGAPFNWSDLKWPPARATGVTGWTEGGGQILLADGSVRYCDVEGSDGVVSQLQENSPAVSGQLTEKPAHSWSFSEPRWGWSRLELDGLGMEGMTATAEIKPDGGIRTVHIHPSSKFSEDEADLEDIRKTVAKFPEGEILLTDAMLDDAAMREIVKLQHLEVLRVLNVRLTDEGLENLANLKSLKILMAIVDDETASRLKEALPDCQVRLTILEPEIAETNEDLAPEETPDARE